MNFGELQTTVAAYLHRDAGDFVFGSVNILKGAINRARKYAEKRNEFDFTKVPARLSSVPLTTGALISTATDLSGNSLSVKQIERAWTADGSYNKLQFLEFMDYQSYQNRLQRRGLNYFEGTLHPLSNTTSAMSNPLPPTLMQHGERVYIMPEDQQIWGTSPVNLRLDVVRWMPDYSADADTDFFLTHGEDWMLYRSLIELQFYLKEDQRVQIGAAVMQEAWDTMLKWNASLVASKTQAYDLD